MEDGWVRLQYLVLRLSLFVYDGVAEGRRWVLCGSDLLREDCTCSFCIGGG